MNTMISFLVLFVNGEAAYRSRMGTKSSNGLTSLQCRMARAGLQWGVRELADRAKVGHTTVVRLELGQGKSNHSTLAALRRVFEAVGVEFTGDDTVAIKKPKNDKKAS